MQGLHVLGSGRRRWVQVEGGNEGSVKPYTFLPVARTSTLVTGEEGYSFYTEQLVSLLRGSSLLEG